MCRALSAFLLAVFFCSCSTSQPPASQSKIVKKLIQDPLTEEETLQVVEESASNWFYGVGLGDTAFKVGSSIVFPPMALVWLTDLGLQATGQGSVSLKAVLPEDTSDEIINNYEMIVSVPGKVTSIVAGEEFRNADNSDQIIRQVLNSHENPMDLSDV